MASSINASTSGAGGVITTADNSGVLNLQSGGTTVATISSTGFSTPANQTINTANTFGFKNRIINGGMSIDQRNGGASVSASDGVYSLDRWRLFASQGAKYTVQQNAGSVTPPTGFINYLGTTSSSSYSVISSDYFAISQVVEGLNIADLAWGTANAKTVTLSFQVYSSLTGTFGGSLQNSALSRSYPFSYTISSANTWTSISVTIVGDTSGTWLTTNGKGIQLNFGLGAGSTNSGTAGSWAAANYISATGATSVVGTNGATFYITGIQLEVGSQATSFDFRDYQTEFVRCQRYFRFLSYGTFGTASSSTAIAYFPTYTNMRTSPTAGLTSGSVVSDNGAAAATAASPTVDTSALNVDGSRVFILGFSGLTTGNTWPLSVANRIFLTAEL